MWPRPIGATEVSERHRHRYEVNNAYRDQIAESGLRFSGTSPDGHLVEFVEYPPDVHPFLVGTQAHPELKSRPTRPHPLFVAFIGAAIDYKAAERLPVEIPEQHPNGSRTSGQRAGSCSEHDSRALNSVAEHDFETVSSETVYRGNILALRTDRSGCPAATSPRAKSSSTTARWPSLAIDDDDNVAWSTSTDIRWAGGCGSCPPGCSTTRW